MKRFLTLALFASVLSFGSAAAAVGTHTSDESRSVVVTTQKSDTSSAVVTTPEAVKQDDTAGTVAPSSKEQAPKVECTIMPGDEQFYDTGSEGSIER